LRVTAGVEKLSCAERPVLFPYLTTAIDAGRTTEPAAKLPCEMSVVVKAARVGDLTDRLARIQRRPTT
jgi:hypothetical protein